ncbi:major facilitator superfamily domain-containing protein [Aspergillus floccosus]
MQYTQQFPPGTAYLGNGQDDLNGVDRDTDGHVVLQPQPSSDPNEPLNWSVWQKSANYAIACLFTLMVFTTLDVGTVTWPSLSSELGYGNAYLNNTYAAGLAGLAIGCIFFIPLASMVGRKPVYISAAIVMVLVNIGQALFQTKIQYVVLQVMAGLAGSVNDTIIQMTIVDLFFVHQRATMNGIYSITVVTGTYLSLIPTGYIIESQGWRWVWWWCAILNGIVLVLIIVGFEETRYARRSVSPVVGEDVPMQPYAEHTKGKSSVPDIPIEPSPGSKTETTIANDLPPPPRRPYRQRITWSGHASDLNMQNYWKQVWRPFVLLFRVPGVAFVAVQYSLMLCWIAVLATTQPILFAAPPYNFSSIGVGNINIAPFVGAVLGSVFGGPLNDYYVVWLARRRSGIYDPEMRLHMLLAPLIITPLGLFLYGISIANGKPWIVPLIGSGCVGFGIGSTTSIILPYFGDSYPELVAEGLVGITYVRNAIATAAAFAISPWLDGLGVQRMFVSVGCLCFGILLLVIPMIVWGRAARQYTAEFYMETVARRNH